MCTRYGGARKLLLVNVAVAIVVDAVADFGGVGVDGCPQLADVVAVGVVGDVSPRHVLAARLHGHAEHGTVAVAIFVGPDFHDGEIFVHAAVAVVVHVVADFGGARVGAPVVIVAVGVVAHEPFLRLAGKVDAHVGVAVPVHVVVRVVRIAIDRVFVDVGVAVFIHPIAVFFCLGVDVCVGVVAVVGVVGVAVRHRAGDDRFAAPAAVSVTVDVGVPCGAVDRIFVNVAVAVVVFRVADFDAARVGVHVEVVAVGVVCDEAVEPVAVHDRRVGIAEAVAVAVHVPGGEAGHGVVVELAVAVFVDAVAHFGCTRVDARVGVVAVGVVLHERVARARGCGESLGVRVAEAVLIHVLIEQGIAARVLFRGGGGGVGFDGGVGIELHAAREGCEEKEENCHVCSDVGFLPG